MKNLLLLLVLMSFFSCKKETKDHYSETKTDATSVKISGQDLFENKGACTACHLPGQKVIGPSIAEIAKIYKEKGGSIVDFLKEESKPIVDPTQYEVMKTNFAITKQMSDEELQALEDYIYTFSK